MFRDKLLVSIFSGQDVQENTSLWIAWLLQMGQIIPKLVGNLNNTMYQKHIKNNCRYISIVKPTRCTMSQIYFILDQHCTCFGRSPRPSTGVYDCTYSIISYKFCGCLLASSHRTCIWHIPDTVCTVLDSWRWTERPSETCRVLFQNKINLRYCASGLVLL
jgi:hypothetical protein